MARLRKEDQFFETKIRESKKLILIVDASVSMKGSKLAMLAVALLTVALAFQKNQMQFELAILFFDSTPRSLKLFQDTIDLKHLAFECIGYQPKGFTNIEGALIQAQKILGDSNPRTTHALLMSDGRYTEGKDPIYLGHSFSHLHTLCLGKEIAGRPLLKALSNAGNGRYFEAREYERLPEILFGLVREILR